LAEAAYGVVNTTFTDEQYWGVFDPEVAVVDDASPNHRFQVHIARKASR
jgi:hypothetical protein